jgi:hypothetical protein
VLIEEYMGSLIFLPFVKIVKIHPEILRIGRNPTWKWAFVVEIRFVMRRSRRVRLLKSIYHIALSMKLKVYNLNSSASVAYVNECLREVNVHDAQIASDVLVFPTRLSELQIRALQQRLGKNNWERVAWDGPQVA